MTFSIDISLDELKDRARTFESRTGLALLPYVSGLEDLPCCRDGRLRI